MRNNHGGSARVLGARGIPLASLRLLDCFISSHSMKPQIPIFHSFLPFDFVFSTNMSVRYHYSIPGMAITKDEGGIGGKFNKRPLRRPLSTPYDRPPSAVRGKSEWFSKLADSAAQIIVKGVSRLFSPVFGKGVASTPGENINSNEEVAEMKSPPEVSEKRGNHIYITLSIDYDGSDESKQELISNIDAVFQLKELNRKKRSRDEIGQLGELIYSKAIEIPECKKKKVEINNNSNINPSSSHQIREEDFGKFFTFGCKSQINHKDCQNNSMTQKVTRKSEMYKMARSPFFGSSMMTNTRGLKRRRSDIDENFFDDERRVRRKSCLKDLNLPTQADTSPELTVLDQEQKRGSSERDEQFFDDERRVRQKSCLKDLDLTTQADTSPELIILDQEQKRGSSERDEQSFDDERRVRRKSCLKDLNLPTQADTSSALSVLDQEQRRLRIDSKGLKSADCKIPLACDIFAPPSRSVEMAKKILYEIN